MQQTESHTDANHSGGRYSGYSSHYDGDEHGSDHDHEHEHEGGAERGRQADSPREIPRLGWRDIAIRVWNEIGNDNVMILAAGVAFYAFLAIVPAIAAMVSIYGLVSDPADVQRQIATLAPILPVDVQKFLTDQLAQAVSHSDGALSVGAIVSIALSLWSANRGTGAMITSVNAAYEEKDRGIVAGTLFGLLFTVIGILGATIALGLVIALPPILSAVTRLVGLSAVTETLLWVMRWPLLFLVVMFGLSLLYHYAPTRKPPKWRWVTWGAMIATTLWLGGSILVSLYIQHIGNYNETYGSLGAVVSLLMWFFFSAFVIIVGAEINAEMEHQTAKDSTEGHPKPMGKRGAYVADHVGPVP